MTLSTLKTLAISAVAAATFAACGSSGGGSSSSPAAIPPPASITTTSTGAKAKTTLTFVLPAPDASSVTAASTTRRSPAFISPGLDKLTFIEDGVKILNQVETDALVGTFTSPDGFTSVSFTATQTGNDYTFIATISTPPGSHTFGAEFFGHAPAVVLSEGQGTYALASGPNAAATLTLNGVLGSYYIECANGPVDSTDCASSYSSTTGLYTLTAIGADFDGFPIPSQGVPYDNGAFNVVETDGNGIVALTNNGPFSAPGTQLTGPSGGYFVSGSYTYGQPFNLQCEKIGVATLALTIAQQGRTSALTGETYSYFDPSNNFPTSGDYPGSGTLAAGSKTPNNPAYHSGTNPNAVTTLTTVNCTGSTTAPATFSLTIN
jgi:hypothetical protein